MDSHGGSFGIIHVFELSLQSTDRPKEIGHTKYIFSVQEMYLAAQSLFWATSETNVWMSKEFMDIQKLIGHPRPIYGRPTIFGHPTKISKIIQIGLPWVHMPHAQTG